MENKEKKLQQINNELDDIVSELKIENLDRPNKMFIYPIALVIFLFFGYLNYKRKIE